MTALYATPHDSITGTARHGDPLLTPEVAPLVGRLVDHLHRAVLVGNPAPVVSRIGSRMRTPEIGDAVVVFDSLFGATPERQHKGTGYLVTCRHEWATTDDEWAAELRNYPDLGDDERSVEVAWYIQYGPEAGDVCRWTDATILAIPTDKDFA